jgi:hypothetical protein
VSPFFCRRFICKLYHLVADCQAVVSLLSKFCVHHAFTNYLTATREMCINQLSNIALESYNKVHSYCCCFCFCLMILILYSCYLSIRFQPLSRLSHHQNRRSLILPDPLQTLPLYVLALLKSAALRSFIPVPIQDRVVALEYDGKPRWSHRTLLLSFVSLRFVSCSFFLPQITYIHCTIVISIIIVILIVHP